MAETLYKEIITAAHQSRFGSIHGDNRPIWMLAEEFQLGKQEDPNNSLSWNNACRLDKLV